MKTIDPSACNNGAGDGGSCNEPNRGTKRTRALGVRASAYLSGCMVIAGLLLAEGAQAASTPQSLIVTANAMNGERVRIFDPNTNKIVYDLNLQNETMEDCHLSKVFCGPIGAIHTLIQGEDYLDMAVYVNDRRQGSSAVDELHSVIVRARPTSPTEVVWKLKELDFSDIPQMADLCYRAPGSPFSTTDPKCAMRMVHTLQIVDDQPDIKQVTVVVSDLIGEKVLQATLDYTNGNQVGHVDWILNGIHSDWPLKGSPNSAQYIPDAPGGPYLLVTYYTEQPDPYGAGGLILWQWNGSGWDYAWAFPDPESGALPYINTPHMGEYLVDPVSGQGWIYYSHSRGLAGDWGSYTQLGGSFGRLALGPTLADPPTYQFDAVLNHSDPQQMTHFSRDIDFLSDGTMLLTDAGCENSAACYYQSRIYHVKPFGAWQSASTRPGNYAKDFTGINVMDVPASSILHEYQCGLYVLFESQWLPASEIGSTLRAAASTAKTPCPARWVPSGPSMKQSR